MGAVDIVGKIKQGSKIKDREIRVTLFWSE